jgi:cobalt-zinc-cadmium efflux system outer membrane protein
VLFAAGCGGSLDPSGDVKRAQSLAAPNSAASDGRWPDAAPIDWLAPPPEFPPAAGELPLTEERAVVLGVSRSPAVRGAVERIARARADLVQSGLLPNPVLAASVGFPLTGGAGVEFSASLVQRFADLWQRDARVASARAELDRAVFEASDAALAHASGTRAAFDALRYAPVRKALAERRAVALRALAEAVEAQGAAGVVAADAVVQARRRATEAAQAQREAAIAHAECAEVMLELLNAAAVPGSLGTGLVRAAEFDRGTFAEGELGVARAWAAAEPGAAGEASGRDVAVALALAWRLDVAAAAASVRAKEAEARVAGVAVPAMGAGAEFSRAEDGARLAGPSVEVEVPVFDDGSARRAAATATLREARLLEAAARNLAAAEAATALVRLRAGLDAARNASLLTAEAERALERAERARRAGVAGADAVLAAQAELAEADLALLDAVEAARGAFTRLRRACGG